MSTPAVRVAIAVAALAAVVVLFFALAGGDDDAATAGAVEPQAAAGTRSVTRSAPATPQSASTRRQTTTPPKPKPRIDRIWVRGGKPAGGARRLEFERGQVVRFSVHSTAADEVHIHGFEIEKALPANRIVLFSFPADIEGVYEVELHQADVKIAELRIGP